MTTISSLTKYRERRQRRALLTDRVTQAAMVEFCFFPLWAIEAGITAANGAITDGKEFAEAMVIARRAVVRIAAANIDRNALRRAQYYERREQHAAEALSVIEKRLRVRFSGRPLAEATARAKRVLEGGGTFTFAMRHALQLGDEQ